MHIPWIGSITPLFVECLESLPNLHTLEISWVDKSIESPLENALERVKLPQIKTLIIPPATHPLLRHCYCVDDFACVVREMTTDIPSDRILDSLASNQDSKVKRLTIPLVSWANPSSKWFGTLGPPDVGGGSLSLTSGFVAVCPRLTELTIIFPDPGTINDTETGYLLNPNESVRSATSELVSACKTLPDFDTLQIVHGCGLIYGGAGLRAKRQRRKLRKRVGWAKDSAISCLKEPETGCRERGGRKKVTVRVIELVAGSPYPTFHLNSARVEECEV